MQMPPVIAITGPTGLIGSHAARNFAQRGFRVLPISRQAEGDEQTILWNPRTGTLRHYQSVDVLLHLAGRSIATRWTGAVKRELWASRVDATAKLCQYLTTLDAGARPKLMIAASAVGFYGDRGDEVLTEDAPPPPEGAGFLPDLGRAWEAATAPAEEVGIHVVHLRLGIVLTREGGALQKMLRPAKLGLLGPMGSGGQWMSWIALPDLLELLGAIVAAGRECPRIINAVSPHPVRQRDFARTLATALHRPAILPMPGFMVKLLFGQMGKEALLGSTRAVPTRLPPGFAFKYPRIKEAIAAAFE